VTDALGLEAFHEDVGCAAFAQAVSLRCRP
jgi:hypothetical protein